MKTILRLSTAAVLAVLLVTALATTTLADVTSKSINTTTGECTGGDACGSATYGVDGFSGRIFGTGTASLYDYICVHTPGDGAFDSYGGTYTLTIGGTSVTETVAGGADCTAHNNAATGTPIQFTFPTSGYVDYSVSISGITASSAQATFERYNSVLNRVFDSVNGSHANSPSVAPPGPTAEIPEAPLPATLLLTGVLVAGGALTARRRLLTRGGR
jgi:hypothetical protein